MNIGSGVELPIGRGRVSDQYGQNLGLCEQGGGASTLRNDKKDARDHEQRRECHNSGLQHNKSPARAASRAGDVVLLFRREAVRNFARDCFSFGDWDTGRNEVIGRLAVARAGIKPSPMCRLHIGTNPIESLFGRDDICQPAPSALNGFHERSVRRSPDLRPPKCALE